MVESPVKGGSGTVAVTGYLKSNDKRKELELVSLLPEDIRTLMGRGEREADWESALPGVFPIDSWMESLGFSSFGDMVPLRGRT